MPLVSDVNLYLIPLLVGSATIFVNKCSKVVIIFHVYNDKVCMYKNNDEHCM